MKTLLYAIGKRFGVYRITKADLPPVELPTPAQSEAARKNALLATQVRPNGKPMRVWSCVNPGKGRFRVFADSKSEARARAKTHLGIEYGRLPLGTVVK